MFADDGGHMAIHERLRAAGGGEHTVLVKSDSAGRRAHLADPARNLQGLSVEEAPGIDQAHGPARADDRRNAQFVLQKLDPPAKGAAPYA